MLHLTKRSIDALGPQAKDAIYFDDDVKGFGLRISPHGLKTYLIQYRAGGRTRRVKVGRHGTLTVEEARKRARELLGAVAKGNNPAAEIIAAPRASALPVSASMPNMCWCVASPRPKANTAGRLITLSSRRSAVSKSSM